MEGNEGIRWFIWEYAVVLERILFRIEEAGLTVSGKKLAVCVPELEILGHVVMKAGRKVAEGKKNKILSWPVPTTATDILKFLGLCSYIRMFIKDFAELSKPLQLLAKKGAK